LVMLPCELEIRSRRPKPLHDAACRRLPYTREAVADEVEAFGLKIRDRLAGDRDGLHVALATVTSKPTFGVFVEPLGVELRTECMVTRPGTVAFVLARLMTMSPTTTPSAAELLENCPTPAK